jgi:hypothetical protein
MTHVCPAEGCETVIGRVFMCSRHWRMVPRPLQLAIYETHESGARAAYVANCREAIRSVAAQELGRKAAGIEGPMKALTVWQPWASLIMIGAKPYEFRRWNFTDRPQYRTLAGQRIVIHAGAPKVRTDEVEDIITRIAEGESALIDAIAAPFLARLLEACRAKQQIIPLSAALGTAVIGEPQRAAVLFADKVADSDRLDQHMYAWPMTDPRPFAEPIPAKGAQQFWRWS